MPIAKQALRRRRGPMNLKRREIGIALKVSV
jgi:hypothetical protein